MAEAEGSYGLVADKWAVDGPWLNRRYLKGKQMHESLKELNI